LETRLLKLFLQLFICQKSDGWNGTDQFQKSQNWPSANIALAEQGLGFVMFFENELNRANGMEKLLPNFPSMPIPYWLVTHRELHTSRRIRLVYDHL